MEKQYFILCTEEEWCTIYTALRKELNRVLQVSDAEQSDAVSLLQSAIDTVQAALSAKAL